MGFRMVLRREARFRELNPEERDELWEEDELEPWEEAFERGVEFAETENMG
ncbi:hypothetical protein HY486_00490 [Candidatus Woesearchaeota archaeon]|nr:hypothetical protein [Candidatus Woesearchaeota archaeon]